MGEVYLARQLSNRRPVAIKMMATNASAPEKAKEYFRREMHVLKSLLMPDGQCHPNIVAFYDVLEIGDRFQLIMEYVAGKNALEWLLGLAARRRSVAPPAKRAEASSRTIRRQARTLAAARSPEIIAVASKRPGSAGNFSRASLSMRIPKGTSTAT